MNSHDVFSLNSMAVAPNSMRAVSVNAAPSSMRYAAPPQFQPMSFMATDSNILPRAPSSYGHPFMDQSPQYRYAQSTRIESVHMMPASYQSHQPIPQIGYGAGPGHRYIEYIPVLKQQPYPAFSNQPMPQLPSFQAAHIRPQPSTSFGTAVQVGPEMHSLIMGPRDPNVAVERPEFDNSFTLNASDPSLLMALQPVNPRASTPTPRIVKYYSSVDVQTVNGRAMTSSIRIKPSVSDVSCSTSDVIVVDDPQLSQALTQQPSPSLPLSTVEHCVGQQPDVSVVEELPIEVRPFVVAVTRMSRSAIRDYCLKLKKNKTSDTDVDYEEETVELSPPSTSHSYRTRYRSSRSLSSGTSSRIRRRKRAYTPPGPDHHGPRKSKSSHDSSVCSSRSQSRRRSAMVCDANLKVLRSYELTSGRMNEFETEMDDSAMHLSSKRKKFRPAPQAKCTVDTESDATPQTPQNKPNSIPPVLPVPPPLPPVDRSPVKATPEPPEIVTCVRVQLKEVDNGQLYHYDSNKEQLKSQTEGMKSVVFVQGAYTEGNIRLFYPVSNFNNNDLITVDYTPFCLVVTAKLHGANGYMCPWPSCGRGPQKPAGSPLDPPLEPSSAQCTPLTCVRDLYEHVANDHVPAICSRCFCSLTCGQELLRHMTYCDVDKDTGYLETLAGLLLDQLTLLYG